MLSARARRRQKKRRRKKLERWKKTRARIVTEGLRSNPFLLIFKKLHAGMRFDEMDPVTGATKIGGLFQSRKTLCKVFGWAVPNQAALDAILAFSEGSIVEIGAGRGYWAALLKLMGADIRAYDEKPPHRAANYYCADELESIVSVYHPVKFGGPEMVQYFSDRTLLMIWPSYSEPWAYEATRLFHELGGTKVIHVGEGWGGCTADDGFFQYIDHHKSDIDHVDIPTWYGIRDYVQLITLNHNPEPFVVHRRCYECHEEKPADGFKLIGEEPWYEGASTTRKIEWCDDCYRGHQLEEAS